MQLIDKIQTTIDQHFDQMQWLSSWYTSTTGMDNISFPELAPVWFCFVVLSNLLSIWSISFMECHQIFLYKMFLWCVEAFKAQMSLNATRVWSHDLLYENVRNNESYEVFMIDYYVKYPAIRLVDISKVILWSEVSRHHSVVWYFINSAWNSI